jgi:hypothetical protein
MHDSWVFDCQARRMGLPSRPDRLRSSHPRTAEGGAQPRPPASIHQSSMVSRPPVARPTPPHLESREPPDELVDAEEDGGPGDHVVVRLLPKREHLHARPRVSSRPGLAWTRMGGARGRGHGYCDE